MALGLRLSLPVQDLKLSTKLGGWTTPHLCPLLNPFPCVPSPARHEHLSAQVRKVKTSQGKLPLPWASVGISFAVFLMGELQHSVTGGCTDCPSRWQEGLCGVNLASTEWWATTQMRWFWLLLLQSPFGHWRHVVPSDRHRQEFLTAQGSKPHWVTIKVCIYPLLASDIIWNTTLSFLSRADASILAKLNTGLH